jgi:catechol 2,3-dioxygenase-like lactoylglutathione lyase family enzyme
VQKTVSILLAKYESGAMSRRQAVAALAGLVAANTECSAAPLSGGALDHPGLQVSNPDRSTKFYRDVLGFTLASGTSVRNEARWVSATEPSSRWIRDVAQCEARRSGRSFYVALSDFNKERVTQQLKAQGVVPIDEPHFTGTGAGFHVVDPDGLRVQLL